MARVICTSLALRDLTTIANWLADHNLDSALKFYDEVDRILILLSHHPLMGEAVDHLSPEIWRHTLGDYLIFYRPVDEGIELIRILHGSRDINSVSE